MDVVRHTVPDNVHQLHVQTIFHVWKTRGCQCSFRLLMMGGVSPETCWASYKYGLIKFDTLLHLVGFFFMNFTMMHGSRNVKFRNHLFADTCLHKRVSLFLCEELILEVCPRILHTFYVLLTVHLGTILVNFTYILCSVDHASRHNPCKFYIHFMFCWPCISAQSL